MHIAGQWVERFHQVEDASPGQERVPPVLIIVCDNTDIAEIFFRKISGESEEEIVTEADVRELLDADEDAPEEPLGKPSKKAKPKTRTVYGSGAIFPTYLSNSPAEKRTIRIDTKLLAEAESDDPNKKRREAAEELRRVVATVGKQGQPGEHVRCVVSVAMLTEGWDANNVTHVLGIRAFGSQLLCEQVVGRGLRRMDYTPDPKTGLLTEEYVDVYGIPFSVIPFKGRPIKQAEPDDRPKNHVKALEERKHFEMRFPVVEGYAFALSRNAIKCDIDNIERLIIQPNREPTATFLQPTVGFRDGNPAQSGPFSFVKQNRQAYYDQTHLQEIQFHIAKGIVDQLTGDGVSLSDAKRRALKLQSRHQLFPQVFQYVREYTERKVDFHGANHCELGLEKYVERTIERLRDAILPDDDAGEPPLLPILNRYKPQGTSAEVDFKTMRACRPTQKSHVDQIVLDTNTWEAIAGFQLEQSSAVRCYVRNDHLGLAIPYEYQSVNHAYEPDFLVGLTNGLTVVAELKGFEDDVTKAKHNAARRWVAAINNWGELGKWQFHVCRDPQTLGRELEEILRQSRGGTAGESRR
jgi:type III restriction enzyme